MRWSTINWGSSGLMFVIGIASGHPVMALLIQQAFTWGLILGKYSERIDWRNQ